MALAATMDDGLKVEELGSPKDDAAAQIAERTATVLAGRFATLCTVDEALARAA